MMRTLQKHVYFGDSNISYEWYKSKKGIVLKSEEENE